MSARCDVSRPRRCSRSYSTCMFVHFALTRHIEDTQLYLLKKSMPNSSAWIAVYMISIKLVQAFFWCSACLTRLALAMATALIRAVGSPENALISHVLSLPCHWLCPFHDQRRLAERNGPLVSALFLRPNNHRFHFHLTRYSARLSYSHTDRRAAV